MRDGEDARGQEAESVDVRGPVWVFQSSLSLLMLLPGTLRLCIGYG